MKFGKLNLVAAAAVATSLGACAKEIELQPLGASDPPVHLDTKTREFVDRSLVESPKVPVGGGETPLSEEKQIQFRKNLKNVFLENVKSAGSSGKIILVLEKSVISYEVSAASTLPIVGLFALGEPEILRGRVKGTLEYEVDGEVAQYKQVNVATRMEGQMTTQETREKAIRKLNQKTLQAFRNELRSTLQRYFSGILVQS